MSRAMDLMEALPTLLAGGYVCERVAPRKKTTYTVHSAMVGRNPAPTVGHITEELYGKLRRRGLLDFEKCLTNKNGFSNVYRLCIPAAQVSTNANRIRAMTDKELADFLHEVGVAEPPWDKAFSREFCDDCRICENTLGFINCPHGRPVDWWMGQEVCADA